MRHPPAWRVLAWAAISVLPLAAGAVALTGFGRLLVLGLLALDMAVVLLLFRQRVTITADTVTVVSALSRRDLPLEEVNGFYIPPNGRQARLETRKGEVMPVPGIAPSAARRGRVDTSGATDAVSRANDALKRERR